MSRQLEPRDVHDQGLRNALYVDAVPNGTAFDQCLAEQFGKRITDNEIVQFPYRIRPGSIALPLGTHADNRMRRESERSRTARETRQSMADLVL